MNAQFEIRLARSASAALSAAIALAFGLNAPAQAQYSYPGTAASSGHYANSIHPIRAGGGERGGRQPSVSGAGYGYGNPSMRRGEACPPGSRCAHSQTGAGSGSSPPSGYGPSQNSNANFRNSATGKSSGPNMNTSGQPTSFTGPNGKQVNMGGTQSFTGPNGQKQTIGGGPDLNNIGGGYGHQKGTGMNMGGTVSFSNGSGSMKQTGSAPGMASANGLNMSNGGAAGVSDQPADAPSKPTGKSNDGGDANGSAYGEALNKANDDWGHPHDGKDSQGNDWSGGKLVNGFDDKGVKYRGGKPVQGGNVPGFKGGNNSDSGDMGPTAGPGEIVSGTGKVVQPGKHTGQDGGGGQGQDSSSSNAGGRNAQGAYIAPSGQDAPVKPKEQGVLKMNYNGKNGAIDPKVNGTNGGGG